MADKEATIYIVDVSRSMGKKHQGRDESDLDWAMRYVWDKITATVASGRKTWTLGVLGLGTDDTRNEIQNDEGYENISVLHPISQVLMPDLRRLQAEIRPSHTDDGDAVSALILAIQMIISYCKKLKYKRRVILVTDACGHIDFDEDSAKEFVKKVNADDIEITVIGVDFDDAEYGFKEEDKSPLKLRNEKFLRELVEQCGGMYGTMAEAIDELNIPRVRSTKPVNSYKGQLRLGNPGQFDTALCIDVERYPRTMIRRPDPASSFVLRSDGGADTMAPSATLPEQGDQPSGTRTNGSGLTVVRSSYTYQVNDPEGLNGERDVQRDDLAKGYEYGRTAVHINESDENMTKLETEAAYEILGFVAADEVCKI